MYDHYHGDLPCNWIDVTDVDTAGEPAVVITRRPLLGSLGVGIASRRVASVHPALTESRSWLG